MLLWGGTFSAIGRHVRRMATSHRPLEPLVAVMGSTGTGKSDVSNPNTS